MKILSLVQEALPISTAKPYRKAWDPMFHKAVFDKQPNKDKNGYRVYLPLASTKSKINIPQDLLLYLKTAIPNRAYTTDEENYLQGLAFEVDNPTRKLGIGKMLARSDTQTQDPQQKAVLQMLKKTFDADPQRKASTKSNLLIAISRHPYDVAGMSTDRGWSSCMNLVDGSNRHYVLNDVREGSIIAYLINSNDLNINRPLARILIKPYKEKKNPSNLIMMGDQVYGSAPDSFKNQVDAWLATNYNDGKTGLYCISSKLYRDQLAPQIRLLSDEELVSMPAKSLIALASRDQNLWERIAKNRPDADDIFWTVSLSDSRAAGLIQNVDMAKFKKYFPKKPQILARLKVQTPEMVEFALAGRPWVVKYVRNRTPEQQAEIMRLIKYDPYIIRTIHQPTAEQKRFAVESDLTMVPWMLENDAEALDNDLVSKYIIKRGRLDGLFADTLHRIKNNFDAVLKDPAVTKIIYQESPGWALDNMPITEQNVADLIKTATASGWRWTNWTEGKERKLIPLLKRATEKTFDPKLVDRIVNTYPNLIAGVSGLDDKTLSKALAREPNAIAYFEDPDPELVRLAVIKGLDAPLPNRYNTDKYQSMWQQLVKGDPGYVLQLSSPSEQLLRVALQNADLWTATQIVDHHTLSPKLQIIAVKKNPRLISSIKNPSLAVQMAAVTRDPKVLKLIAPAQRHAAARAYVNVLNREMSKT